ncbi:MAG: hypothetical protein NVS2B8_06650 [Vulcanimicrobiaceae bacterium]
MPPKSPEATASPAAARAVAYVDVFVQPKTARVDRALTYAVPAESDLDIGDIVRVPLGPRELYGFVISSPRAHVGGGGSAMVRPIAAHVESARAFDATGLALARWIAQRYCCSLGECEVLGPAPYPIVRVNDEYRYRLAVKARDAEHVRRFLGKRTIATRERDVRVAINVDP